MRNNTPTDTHTAFVCLRGSRSSARLLLLFPTPPPPVESPDSPQGTKGLS